MAAYELLRPLCDTQAPTGPWRYRGAILTSDARFKGPGHHAFLRDPATGIWHIAHHRWEASRATAPIRGNDASVLPKDMRVLPVGGIAPDTMQPWRDAGAAGFGLGSALYKPGLTAIEVGERAAAFVAAIRA